MSGAVRADLNQGRADNALQKLNAALAQDAKDAEAHNLRCRVDYQEELWAAAVGDCEAAVRLDPNNSNFHLWLGRAYGRKAAESSLMAGYGLARRVKAEFAMAVQLDPRNAAALADLGEFDVNAPAVAGGGISRAQALVPQLQNVSPADALQLQARIAEAKKDYARAEADLKTAITQSVNPAESWMDLAAFYLRRKRLDDMVAAVHNGAALDRAHGPALVRGAVCLDRAGREPETAIRWLQEYLSSPAQSESAPAFAVHALLAHLLLSEGREQAARQELSEVRNLASGYRIPSSGGAATAGL